MSDAPIDDSLVTIAPTPSEPLPSTPDADAPAVGRWYWVHEQIDEDEPALRRKLRRRGRAEGDWLACVVHIGSNYAELEGVTGSVRVHFDEFESYCTLVPDADAVIRGHVERYQEQTHALMMEVRTLTARLAITPGHALAGGSEVSALALRTDQPMDEYKTALVLAKDETLPELFEKIKTTTAAMAHWMSATLIPLKAQARALEPAIGAIKNRIFSVELYAGLVEQVEQVREGEPAALTEQVHLFQRRAYMDEECLAQYETGGMEFKDLPAFDQWLGRQDNLDRLLPFPRCVLAFQVRRNQKDREVVDLSSFLRVLEEIKADKLTFLYIRNGEQLFRMSTAIEFGEKLFPDMDQQRLSGKLWARMSGSHVEKLISDDEHFALIAEQRAKEAERDALPEDEQWRVHVRDYFTDYVEFSPDTVYHDDIAAHIQEQMTKHNRLVLVLQGLLDRSVVLHPHPPWSLWTAAGFTQALSLVYDDARALVAGEKPDFKAYRTHLNASLTAGSVTVGQQDAWLRHEGKKESERMDNDYRTHGHWRPTHHRPHGNPGPGELAIVTKVSTSKGVEHCTYAWGRSRISFDRDSNDEIRCTFTAPTGRLLNVSAYTPGDFKLFFNDPRTRAEYMKWAPLLLEAEEFHAGNRELKPPKAPTPRRTTDEGSYLYQQRKARRAANGKAVRLKRKITTRANRVYEAGTLWRAYSDGRGTFDLVGITPDGLTERTDRRLAVMDLRDFTVDATVPAETKPDPKTPEPKDDDDDDDD